MIYKFLMLLLLTFNSLLGTMYLLALTENPERAFKGFIVGMLCFFAALYLFGSPIERE